MLTIKITKSKILACVWKKKHSHWFKKYNVKQWILVNLTLKTKVYSGLNILRKVNPPPHQKPAK